MEANDKHAAVSPGSLGPKGNFWIRFVLGAIAVFVIWFFVIRPNTIELNWAEQKQLLGLAREQLIASVAGDGLIEIYPPELSDRILRDGAAFVTLTVDGALRGCMIDQFEPHEPLVVNVLRNIGLAAGADNRFAALAPEEIDHARITISIVYDIEALTFEDSSDLLEKLDPNLDGVILEVDGNIATYLPSVWQTFPDPTDFLSQLCIKAGWDAERWRTEPYPTIQTYQVFEVAESE
jgi:uncharacterized protein